jgi:hypothetical protein
MRASEVKHFGGHGHYTVLDCNSLSCGVVYTLIDRRHYEYANSVISDVGFGVYKKLHSNDKISYFRIGILSVSWVW